MEQAPLPITDSTISSAREGAATRVGCARTRATEGWWRRPKKVVGDGGALAGPEADGGARRPDGRGREGGKEGVQEDQQLTLVLVEDSRKRGEVGLRRKRARRRRTRAEEIDSSSSILCFPARTDGGGGGAEHGGPLERLAGARSCRNQRGFEE